MRGLLAGAQQELDIILTGCGRKKSKAARVFARSPTQGDGPLQGLRKRGGGGCRRCLGCRAAALAKGIGDGGRHCLGDGSGCKRSKEGFGK